MVIRSEKFNVQEQLQKFNELSGTMLACGTCIKSRQMQFAICPISTMKDMLKIVEESDKVLLSDRTSEIRKRSTNLLLIFKYLNMIKMDMVPYETEKAI